MGGESIRIRIESGIFGRREGDHAAGSGIGAMIHESIRKGGNAFTVYRDQGDGISPGIFLDNGKPPGGK